MTIQEFIKNLSYFNKDTEIFLHTSQGKQNDFAIKVEFDGTLTLIGWEDIED